MYKNTRTYTMPVWEFGSVFQGKIILQVAALCPDPTFLGHSWCCLMWSPYVCSTSTSPGSSRRLLCLKNGCLSARSKNFLQMDPTNWERWGIPPRPPILMYCIEHHSDILLQISWKEFILKKIEGFAPLTQISRAQESHYKHFFLSHFAWQCSLFFSVLPGKCRGEPETGPELVPSTSLPIHWSLAICLSDNT